MEPTVPGSVGAGMPLFSFFSSWKYIAAPAAMVISITTNTTASTIPQLSSAPRPFLNLSPNGAFSSRFASRFPGFL